MKKNKIVFCLGLSLCILAEMAHTQEVVNDFETRTSVQLVYKPIKKLKLSLSPEFRFDESYSLSKYFIEGEAAYKANKLFTLGASYRFVINPREDKDTEYLSRYDFNVILNKKYDRFYPSIRLAYSNYADDETENSSFLRYKAALEYDIPKCKINPVFGIEAYNQLSEDGFYKMRYSIGTNYKLFKGNYIGVKYKFDYYLNEYKNKHIISLNYKIKF